MSVYLKLRTEPDRLCVKLGRFEHRSQFDEELQRLKTQTRDVPGRRYNGETKEWEFPPEGDVAQLLIDVMQPDIDAGVRGMIQEHRQDIAEALVHGAGDDARLEHPFLNFALFPYQRAFVDWAMTHQHCILGDEMGVGKTIEAIACVWERDARIGEQQDEGPVLVVTPNGLRRNYRNEIVLGPQDADGRPIYDDWPSGEVQLLDGANLPTRTRQLTADAEWFVTNWEKLRSDGDVLSDVPWRAVIASEAHRAKNREAQQTKALWKLRAPLQIAETGTPIMNSPDELWSLLHWLDPVAYDKRAGGAFWAFHHKYVDSYISKGGRPVVRGIKNPDALRFELNEKLIRRTKRMVLPDLPDKLPPAWVPVDFKPAEGKLYREAEEALFLDIKTYVWEEANRRFNAGEAATTDDEVRTLTEELANMPLERLERSIPNGGARIAALRQVTAGAKARIAAEMVLDAPNTPVVTFTWFVDAAKWLVEQLRKAKLDVGMIAGPGGDATDIANEFQRGDTDQIVCTIAKSQGFDLYRAHHAIFADRDWVPARNDQALDRLHRQGQKSDVSSTILYVPDTVDDGKVMPAEKFKRSIVAEVLGDG